MTELEKYQGIYGHSAYAFYGHSNHGVKATGQVAARLQRSGKTAVVDVGCGWNEWANQWNAGNPHSQAVGVDFACPGADIRAPATALPFPDKSAGVVTSFDMLEHLQEAEVAPCLAEFARVADSFVFSISHVPSRVKWAGETLHPTVRPRDWWLAQIVKAGGHNLEDAGGYLSGEWGNEVWQPQPEHRVIVVGNGPSLLAAELGEKIDAFDEVIRFNRYQIEGFEAHTGTRTTLWSTFGHGYLPGTSQRPTRMIYVYGERGDPAYAAEELYRIPRSYYQAQQAKVQALSGKTTSHPLGMSSGCVVLQYLLEVVGLPQVTMVGMDHFRKDFSSQHHYYNPKSYGRPPELDGDAEALLLQHWQEQGRLEILR